MQKTICDICGVNEVTAISFLNGEQRIYITGFITGINREEYDKHYNKSTHVLQSELDICKECFYKFMEINK